LGLALQYYEIAADGGSREAAGLAGKFHLLGIGYEGDEMVYLNQHGFNPEFPSYEFLGDTASAVKYLRMGAPGKVHSCHPKANSASLCDAEAMNGLGLAYLIGIPGEIPRDTKVAKAYFQLAKDKGSMDATFHMGMMRLGWWNSESTSSTKLNKAGLETRKKNVQMGVSEISKAANKRHMQALHRLGTFHSHGIPLNPEYHDDKEGSEKWILEPKCKTALNMFKLLLDGAPISSKRTRRAYKQYVAGDTSGALKNYMASAETGNVVGMMNAAWLLERNCPLPESEQWRCTRASLRYWTEAGRLGNVEAILNIGDFYYYNRFESISEGFVHMSLEGQAWIVGKVQNTFDYVLFPEKLWKDGKAWLVRLTKQLIFKKKRKKTKVISKADETTCKAEEDGICKSPFTEEKKENENEDLDFNHFEIAATYYKKAAKGHNSARANFNLGFMHQWGIGLKQDFPLAKRYYDLSKNMNPIAVQLALYGMRWHEKIVRVHTSIGADKKKMGVFYIIASHFLSVETGVITGLVIILTRMLQKRRNRHNQNNH